MSEFTQSREFFPHDKMAMRTHSKRPLVVNQKESNRV
jgi:hypothetical protein